MEGRLVIRIVQAVSIADRSSVGDARRAAAAGSEEVRLGATAAGKVALVATELATNQIKHAGGGSILIGSDDETSRTLVMIAIDKGRGIENVDLAMSDGYSTAGSPGTGLGAIARNANSCDIWSMPGRGTVILVRISEAHDPAPPRHPIDVAGICIAKAGEVDSGDAWTAVRDGDGGVTIEIADGLGHGTQAAQASRTAIMTMSERPALSLDNLLHDQHGALRPTRGAAIGIARLQPSLRRLEFAGVGNIAGTIVCDDAARKVVSQPGIVGHEMRKVQVYTYPCPSPSAVFLQSDGIGSSANLDNYPGIAQRDAAVIAALLYRDFCRGTDDATVVVAKVAGW
jgi:anti-sigma regulatory factor (Ser/Thr protein kinase)